MSEIHVFFTRTLERVEHAAIEAGLPLAEVLRRAGVSQTAFYRWKRQAPRSIVLLAKALEAAERAKGGAQR